VQRDIAEPDEQVQASLAIVSHVVRIPVRIDGAGIDSETTTAQATSWRGHVACADLLHSYGRFST
jgi:hypothetical protein